MTTPFALLAYKGNTRKIIQGYDILIMNQEIKDILQEIYIDHKLRDTDLDYRVLDRYRYDLERLSLISGRCFFIVDLHTFEYIYTSDNFKNIFGCMPTNKCDSAANSSLLDSKIHPDDFFEYKKIMLKIGDYLLTQPKEERINYRHIFELRIQNIQKEYIRVSWERQPLETDKSGNLWLILGTIHVLSNQSDMKGVNSFFVNLRTGEQIPFNISNELQFTLTTREKEILTLIQQGLLSKEIAEKLFISVNTVNIHRQNILRKMHAGNSIEALNLGRAKGIIS